jgi:subtilisin
MIPRSFHLPVMMVCIVLSTTFLRAQTKIESAIQSDFRTKSLVRVLIVTRADPDRVAGGASLASPSGYLVGRLGGNATNLTNIGTLPVAAAEITEGALNQLREDPNVVLVTRDIPVPPTLMDSVPLIGGDRLHQLGIRGTNRTVAILDTGVQADHPALLGALIAEACFSTAISNVYKVTSLCPGQFDVSTMTGAASQCPPVVDGCEHGTHVAGIIAGHQMAFEQRQFEGVAPSAKVVAVQVFTLFEGNACGAAAKCVLSFTSDQLRALDWLYKHREELKIAAINMSLGTGYHDQYCDQTSALTEMIERLRGKGIPTVIAAGNDHFFDGLAEPACISASISVAATKKDGSLDVRYSNVSTLIHIAAPGTEIVSSVPGSRYIRLSGTSMAAPHVAAALALLREKYPGDTVAELERRLTNGAPIVADPRTGTKLPVLELVHATSQVAASPSNNGGLVAPAASTPVTGPQSNAENASTTTIPSGSFIVQTQQTGAQLQGTLSKNCSNVICNLKPIGQNMYKLDIAPHGTVNPESRSKTLLNAEDVHKLLDGAANIKVFDNRLSAPFQPPKL